MKKSRKIIIGIIIGLVLIYASLIVVAYLPQRTIPVEKLSGKEDKFVKVKGWKIHYLQQGQGKNFILVHGFACSTSNWKRVIPLLAKQFKVYALDLLGFGLSDKPMDGRYDLESQGKLVIDFMDALQIPSAVLVGHSMGGVVVAYAALKAPTRVDALVLVDAGFYSSGAPAFLKYIFFPLDRILAKIFYSKKMRVKSFTRSYYNKSFITEELIEAYLRPTRTPGAVEALAKMMREVGPKNYEGISVWISRPTLILWGEKDEVIPPAIGARLKREIKGAKLVIIPQCGHMLPEEKAEEFSEAVDVFLRSIKR